MSLECLQCTGSACEWPAPRGLFNNRGRLGPLRPPARNSSVPSRVGEGLGVSIRNRGHTWTEGLHCLPESDAPPRTRMGSLLSVGDYHASSSTQKKHNGCRGPSARTTRPHSGAKGEPLLRQGCHQIQANAVAGFSSKKPRLEIGASTRYQGSRCRKGVLAFH